MEQNRDSPQSVTGTHGVVNSGVYITGGNVSGPVAAGRNARAVQVAVGPAETVRRIDALLADLETQAGTLVPERAEDIADDVGRLRAEVHHRRPSADSIRLILGRLTGAVAATATLLAKVDQIKDLITQLIR